MTIDGPDGYRTRDLEVGHVVNVDDEDWAVTDLVDMDNYVYVIVYLRNADGVEHTVTIHDVEAHVWDVVRQPDDDLHND